MAMKKPLNGFSTSTGTRCYICPEALKSYDDAQDVVQPALYFDLGKTRS